MNTLDIINAAFEGAAGLFVLNHCRVLLRDRETRGVSIASTAFFMVWGLWNVFYYPALEQPWSAAAGVFVVVANAIYIGLMVRFRRAVRRAPVPVIDPDRHPTKTAAARQVRAAGVGEVICLHRDMSYRYRDEHETNHC